jgi:hypothetical protein
MTTKQKYREKDKKFENSVKPYYHSSPSNECFVVYSPEKKLSLKTEFVGLSIKDVKKKFGFDLICGDLTKSTNEAFRYIADNNILLTFAASLEPFINDNGIFEHYSNTHENLILHPSQSKMGLEVVSGGELKKGFVLAEYLGERLSPYDLVADSTYFLSDVPNNVYIDAKYYGNIARLFNHCPHEHSNPNVLTANLDLVAWQASENLTRMFFITTRDIETFEPICWDYGSKYQFNHPMELLDVKTYLPIESYDDL